MDRQEINDILEFTALESFYDAARRFFVIKNTHDANLVSISQVCPSSQGKKPVLCSIVCLKPYIGCSLFKPVEHFQRH